MGFPKSIYELSIFLVLVFFLAKGDINQRKEKWKREQLQLQQLVLFSRLFEQG